MVIQFISRNNNLNYNIKFAKLLGLYSAVYLSLLIDIYSVSKESELIKLSRDEIYNLTGIEEEKQIQAEANLQSYNLIKVNPLRNSSSKNYYSLNLELIETLINMEEHNIEDHLKVQNIEFKPSTKSPAKVSKRQKIIDNLKNNINLNDPISKKYLQDWIDNVMQKAGYLSKNAVEYMSKELLTYSNNNENKLQELCQLAAILVYKDPKWVIYKYEEKHNISLNNTLNLDNHINQAEVEDNLNKLKDYKGETF